jgi:hypothetical protein
MASGTRSDPEANNWYLTHLVNWREKTLRYNDFVSLLPGTAHHEWYAVVADRCRRPAVKRV